jgi:hypothetical protein
MSIHAFPVSVAPPAVLPVVAAARELVTAGASVGLGSVPDGEVAEAIAGLAVLQAQVESWRFALEIEADARALAEREAATGTDAWVAALTGSTREVAAGGLRLARLLSKKYAATRAAFAAGRLRIEQVRVSVNAAEQIPATATAGQVAMAEEWLVAQGTGEGTRDGRPRDAKRLRRAAHRMCTPISHELMTAHQDAMLGREHAHAETETWFSLADTGNGTYAGRFVIPELHGLLLRRHLETLSAPRRLTRDRHGEPVTDPTLPGSGWVLSGTERPGLAFTELLEHLPTDGHATNGTTLLVTLDLDVLRTGPGAARLETGDHLGAGEARRLACNAGLVPAVLGTDSVPLDLGRETRLRTKAQRQALSLTHDSCAVTGCQRPFAWCEIHYPHPWSAGGRTDLANALPLCFFHHRRAHDDHFDLRRTPDGDWRFHRRT